MDLIKVLNKWNGKEYTLIAKGSLFKLQRSDGSVFEIEPKEYYFSYKEVDND